MQVFRYMKEHGLPDESCLTYNATDHTKFAGLKECPAEAKCLNCAPIETPAPDFSVDTCWPVETPVLYGVCGCLHSVSPLLSQIAKRWLRYMKLQYFVALLQCFAVQLCMQVHAKPQCSSMPSSVLTSTCASA